MSRRVLWGSGNRQSNFFKIKKTFDLKFRGHWAIRGMSMSRVVVDCVETKRSVDFKNREPHELIFL